MFGEACPASAPFFGYMGAAAALIFASELFACSFLCAMRPLMELRPKRKVTRSHWGLALSEAFARCI